MNQVEQSVAEYVDEVWEDVVADIEQLGFCSRCQHHPVW